VTREYRKAVTVGKWGAVEYVNTGIEGYGWGALSILLLIRYLLGFREEEAGVIQVAPVLPQVMRRVGATYLPSYMRRNRGLALQAPLKVEPADER
jgi:hypothetical protein